MVYLRSALLMLCGACLLAVLAATPASAWQRVAPYDGLRFAEDEVVHVRHGGEWHRLVAIDGKTTAELKDASRRAYGELWKKRFVEDMAEVMTEAGAAPANTVSLTLGDLVTGVEKVVPDVPMTEEKRRVLFRDTRQE